ncbi:MAG TPA: hypothetical protein VNJ03_12600 [Vicinamibacterales bacterium]|nr:hypothetical protein [Vicinamibacterales bacterium]
MTAVLVAEGWPALRLQRVWPSPPQLYGSLGNDNAAVLFEYPIPGDPMGFPSNLRYMYFSTWHWTPMVNGYSGFLPSGYGNLARAMAEFPDGPSVAYLQGQGVTHVTVHCSADVGRPCRDVLPRLDADPRFRLITTTHFEGQPARLYVLAR